MNKFPCFSSASLSLILAQLGWLCWAGLSLAADIVVLQSHDGFPYQQALAGFKAGFSAQEAHYTSYIVSNEAEAEAVLPVLKGQPPKLLLTLGTPATRIALAHEHSLPVVAALVLDTDELRQHSNATGVGLSFPPAMQWHWLRRLLPDARHIAMIYDPRHSKALFQAMQTFALGEGIALIPTPVSSPEDLPKLLQNLPAQLDALWAVDGGAFNSGTAVQELLLYSFRNRTPVIGLSAQWAKAGAIYALDWDYVDIGRQAAELASAILQKGMAPAALKPLAPRKIRPVLNGKTAEHMKLTIPKQWQSELEILP